MARKRFPADTSLKYDTFLNNRELNSELYGSLQSFSELIYIQGQERPMTIVRKKKIPKQTDWCLKLKIASPKTLRTRLNKLIDAGYVVKMDNGDYLLPEVEDVFNLIPDDTINYLLDTCKKHVFKIYIYLLQRNSFANQQGRCYEFTSEEIGEHIGISVRNNVEAYRIIKNSLDLLQNSGLIDYDERFNDVKTVKILRNISLEVKSSKK